MMNSSDLTMLKTIVLKFLASRFFSRLKVASSIDNTKNSALENTPILIVKKHGMLGKPGDQIRVPRDEMLYRHLMARGSWDKSTVEFLVKNTKNELNQEVKHTLIDLGSNIGMVTLQALNQTKLLSALCVEPVDKLMRCAEFNLRLQANRVKLFEYALSENDGAATFYTDSKNCGNGSLSKSLVTDFSRAIEIKTKSAKTFFTKDLEFGPKYLLKSDMQGHESKVLREIPIQIWDSISAAVLEIWATPLCNLESVTSCVKAFEKFNYISWSPKKQEKLNSSEIIEFWMQGGNQIRNLYLSN